LQRRDRQGSCWRVVAVIICQNSRTEGARQQCHTVGPNTEEAATR
jgi:hypothetical protein